MGSKVFKRPAGFIVPVLLVAFSISLAVGFYALFSKPSVLAEGGETRGEVMTSDGDQVVFDLSVSTEDYKQWCTFIPEETGYYEISFEIAGNAAVSETLYKNGDWFAYAGPAQDSFKYKFYKDSTYTIGVETGYGSGVTATVKVSLLNPVTSGSCGSGATWSYDLSTDTLTIGGSGAMNDYGRFKNEEDDGVVYQEISPWSFFKNELQNVEIGSGITYIGRASFYENGGLSDVTIPDSVTGIGEYAFASCNNLKTATIGSGITEFSESMFYHCGALRTINLKEDAVVTKIDKQAFYMCENLTDFTIPDTVTVIGDYAFGNCLELQNIRIPSGLTSLGAGAFSYCSKLDSAVIPEGVTRIEDNTFYYCYNLTDVTIPSTVKVIGNDAFYYCTRMKNVELPSGLTSIGNEAFKYCYGYYFTKVIIPEGVTSIGSSAFASCYYLEEVTIPSTVTSIGNSAFYSCYALTAFVIPDGVTRIESYTFSSCSKLADITIPDSVQSIGQGAFASCSSLTDVVIPEGVTSIEEETFDYCSNLKNMTIPSTVESLGKSAFAYCSSLERIDLPEDLETIGVNAFKSCYSLKEIDLGEKLLTIGEYAFSSCDGLTSVSIPGRVKTIGNGAFNYCSKLKDVNISSGAIGSYAFSSCSKIENVVLGNGVTSIGTEAFSYCTSLTSISIPGSVGIIGDGAFYSCSALEEVAIEEGVQTIGADAFQNCSKITEITIPASVTEIRDSAFNGCSGISDVYCYANPEKLSWTKANNDFMPWTGGQPFGRTKCHVFAADLDAYNTKFGSGQSNRNYKVNVTFVGDLSETIDLGLGEHLYGCTLSLSGDIGVNFYMDLSSADLSEDAYIEFTVPNGDSTVVKKVYVQAKGGEDRTVAETVADGENTYYVFKCQVSAKEVSSPIQAQMIDGGRSGKKYTYSVKSYADYLLAHTNDNAEYAKAAPLVKALVSYCSWSQFYFKESYLDHIDHNFLNYDEIMAVTGTEVKEAAPQAVIDLDGLSGVTFEGATLSLKSETTLSLYFSSSEKLTFSCNRAYAIETTRVEDYQVVRIRGIAASDLDEVFEINVSCGGRSGMVRYSVLNYISNVINGNYDDYELNCVVKALYLYYKAAEAYAG